MRKIHIDKIKEELRAQPQDMRIPCFVTEWSEELMEALEVRGWAWCSGHAPTNWYSGYLLDCGVGLYIHRGDNYNLAIGDADAEQVEIIIQEEQIAPKKPYCRWDYVDLD